MKPFVKILAAFLLPLCMAAAQGQALSVFTAEQARQGQALYVHNCAACHGPDLEGLSGPALTGPGFRQMLTDQNLTAASLLSVVMNTMPYDSQGNLPDAQFEAIVAYILSRSGYPAGTEKLAPDNPHLAELKFGS